MRPAGKCQAWQNTVPGPQGWRQPSKEGESAKEVDERLQSIVSELTETVSEGNVLKALGLTLNGERVAQHALVSGLLALEVLVTGSLPASMLTQVRVHQQVLCCIAPCHLYRRTLYLLLLLCFNVLGTNRGPTDRIQHIRKHLIICHLDAIDSLHEKHSLRKPSHAFGSELVKKSETENYRQIHCSLSCATCV